MNENMNSNFGKRHILMIVFLMIGVIIVGTFAWLSYRTQDTAMVLTVGDIKSAVITLSPYQISSTIGSVTGYSSGIVTNVDAVNHRTTNQKFRLYYQVDSIDSALAISSFKFTVTRSSTKNGTYSVYANGSFAGVTSGNNVTVLEDTLAGGATYYYKVYLWLDGSGNVSSAQGKSFSGELRAEIITLPSEYQQVEYLESNGSQYILTDVVPSSNFKLEADVYAVSGGGSQPSFAGVADTSSIQYYYNSSGNLRVWTNTGSIGSSTAHFNQTVHYIAETSSSGIKLSVNGTKYSNSYVYPGATTRNLMIFAYNGSSGPSYYFRGRIYNLKLYDNNVLIRNFVPCYKINGPINTPGLYDMVTAKFYEKGSSSSEFTYGPAV